MKQVMGSFPQGLPEKFFVQPENLRIFVGFANALPFVFAIDGLDACQAGGIVGDARLTAAADASSRTCHDFNEMILRLAAADPVQ